MTEWYYADRQGQQRGPVQTQELLALRNAGQIAMDTLVWRNGMSGWQAFSTVANDIVPPQPETTPPMQGSSMYEMATPAPAPAAPAPAAEASYSMYDVAKPVVRDDASDPYAAPRTQVGDNAVVVRGGHVVDAGFWKRTAAYMIDGLLLGIVGYAVQLPILLGAGLTSGSLGRGGFSAGMGIALTLAYLLPIAIQMMYYAWFHASEHQATLGKRAIGIKVTNMEGGRISFARGIGRYWAFMLSSFTFGIGFIMAAFTERKQALHDMIASTYVVDKWAYTEHPEWQDETLGTLTKIVLGLGLALFMLGALAMCAVIGAALSHR
ncbi:RDD family protein [Solilutibacter silvestris]|uniref:RDD family n=1 Tax=Solilutibacter silvestris TaxID=1645665 RepID=A0A2K1Q0F9_9GAMM|nr:RDD family protein [Lysobacter silvestris]PNS08521.1 RDD family [Lysobacter silvestris]